MAAPLPQLIVSVSFEAVDIQLGKIENGQRRLIISVDGRIVLEITSCRGVVNVIAGNVSAAM